MQKPFLQMFVLPICSMVEYQKPSRGFFLTMCGILSRSGGGLSQRGGEGPQTWGFLCTMGGFFPHSRVRQSKGSR